MTVKLTAEELEQGRKIAALVEYAKALREGLDAFAKQLHDAQATGAWTLVADVENQLHVLRKLQMPGRPASSTRSDDDEPSSDALASD